MIVAAMSSPYSLLGCSGPPGRQSWFGLQKGRPHDADAVRPELGLPALADATDCPLAPPRDVAPAPPFIPDVERC